MLLADERVVALHVVVQRRRRRSGTRRSRTRRRRGAPGRRGRPGRRCRSTTCGSKRAPGTSSSDRARAPTRMGWRPGRWRARPLGRRGLGRFAAAGRRPGAAAVVRHARHGVRSQRPPAPRRTAARTIAQSSTVRDPGGDARRRAQLALTVPQRRSMPLRRRAVETLRPRGTSTCGRSGGSLTFHPQCRAADKPVEGAVQRRPPRLGARPSPGARSGHGLRRTTVPAATRPAELVAGADDQQGLEVGDPADLDQRLGHVHPGTHIGFRPRPATRRSDRVYSPSTIWASAPQVLGELLLVHLGLGAQVAEPVDEPVRPGLRPPPTERKSMRCTSSRTTGARGSVGLEVDDTLLGHAGEATRAGDLTTDVPRAGRRMAGRRRRSRRSRRPASTRPRRVGVLTGGRDRRRREGGEVAVRGRARR